MEDGASIEMAPVGRGYDECDDREQASKSLPSTDPMVRVKSRKLTQNRCFALVITVFISTALVYTFSFSDAGASMFRDHFQKDDGVLNNNYASPKEEANRQNSSSTTSVGKKAMEHDHPGETYPGDAMAKCNYRQFRSWLDTPVTKGHGKMYTVFNMTIHDRTSFTQGLSFANKVLYESTGLYGKSKVRILDPERGNVLKSVDMDANLFGEGMTYWKGKLVQITWKSKNGFIYNATTLEQIQHFKFSTTNNEGWGITYDWCQDEFVVTDGSPYLHFWDPNDLKEKRKIKVIRMDGSPARELNEIEYWRGKLLANIWFEDVLLVIDMESGKVEKEYDFSDLWPKQERSQQSADVFNGISISEDEDSLYVTGKLWNRMYKIRLNVRQEDN